MQILLTISLKNIDAEGGGDRFLGSKSGMQSVHVSQANKCCNLVFALWVLGIVALTVVAMFASSSSVSVIEVASRMRFRLVAFISNSSSCAHSFIRCLQAVLLHTVVLWTLPLTLSCVSAVHAFHECSRISSSYAGDSRKSLLPDLVGGGGLGEIGSKQWLDAILAGLAARQLKPPMQQAG